MIAPPPLLEVKNLATGYGAISVISSLSLHVAGHEVGEVAQQGSSVRTPGEAIAVIGANGAGKSTLLRVLSGLIPLHSGSIHFRGQDISHDEPHLRVMQGLIQVPEGRQVFPRMTVRENLMLGGYLRPKDEQFFHDLERSTSLFPILSKRASQPAGTLSGGEQQMLAIARALMSQPKLLLLDEPSMGVAPLVVERIFEVLALLRDTGMSMLLVEQNALLALEFASRTYVLETGAVTCEGPSEALKSDPRIQSAYLGSFEEDTGTVHQGR